MFLTTEKIEKRHKELSKSKFEMIEPLNHWYFIEDKNNALQSPPETSSTSPAAAIEDEWSGRDQYFWLINNIKIPEIKNKNLMVYFDIGRTNSGNNSGYESLLFINGKEVQALDSNHPVYFIPEELQNTSVSIAIRLWSGLEGGGPKKIQNHRLENTYLGIHHQYIHKLSTQIEMALKYTRLLNENDSKKYFIISILDRAIGSLNLDEAPEKLDRNCKIAYDTMLSELKKIAPENFVNLNAIGHSHIDVAWLWEIKHTKEKIVRTFTTVLSLMDRYPEFVYMQSQPLLYQFIKNSHPEIYQKIKEKISSGQWEVNSPMWVEADCNIPSGESLVRQILYGKLFAKEEFDIDSTVLWLPDVFGYSWALPQILKKSGIDTFVTSKISWNRYNQMPHDTFKWRGIDGTEILTYLISTPEPHNYHADSFQNTYNGVIEPETVLGTYNKYQDKSLNQNLLIPFGYGDGGGGPTFEMIENIEALNNIPSVPNINIGPIEKYFDNLHSSLNEIDEYIHTWDGELYLEAHRGTYTSQSKLKSGNRRLEILLRELELMAVVKNVFHNQEYPDYKSIWKNFLIYQFHDILPGSSIKEVNDDTVNVYKEIHTQLLETENDLMKDVFYKNKSTFSVFNSSPWNLKDYIYIESREDLSFYNCKNRQLDAAKYRDGHLVWLEHNNPFGFEVIYSKKESKNTLTNGFIVSHNHIENPHYIIEWNQSGHITRLFDIEYKREIITDNGIQLIIYEDKPLMFDAWDIDIFYQQKYDILDADEITVIQFDCAVEIIFKYEYNKSTIEQRMKIYTHSRRIDFECTVDWHEKQKLLKTHIPTTIRSTEATFDIQFGNIKRPTHWNTTWDYAKFESVGHQWIDLSEYNYGLGLLNDSKYGHSVKDHIMTLSLLKSPVYPDPEADEGTHHFTYSLYPHDKDFVQSEIVQEAWKLNNPFKVFNGEAAQKAPLIKIHGTPDIQIDSIKKCEHSDDVIIRMHDFSGGRQNISISPNFECSGWTETNLLEKVISHDNKVFPIEFILEPFEIKTILIKRM
ncbi:alpha-mannosidase [Salinicoccus sp. YB14-2]|uniref:alpha-mannosidase n=1 Tax=Salinicoccus sp. YB14-2 TaxID=1572701 RepID=UPI00068EBF4F|nr:alpha-mannosidase [Salinicoccus sp. YB14-2]